MGPALELERRFSCDLDSVAGPIVDQVHIDFAVGQDQRVKASIRIVSIHAADDCAS